MRTKQRRGAKSQAIRAYLGQNPNASAPEVVAALGRQGLKVTPAFVYNLRSGTKKKGRKGRRKGAVAAHRNGASRAPTAGQLSAEQLVATKELADQLGGTDKLRRALELLDKLQ